MKMKHYTFFRDGETIGFEATTEETVQKLQGKGHQILQPEEVAGESMAEALGHLNHLAVAVDMMGEAGASSIVNGMWDGIYGLAELLGFPVTDVDEDDVSDPLYASQ